MIDVFVVTLQYAAPILCGARRDLALESGACGALRSQIKLKIAMIASI